MSAKPIKPLDLALFAFVMLVWGFNFAVTKTGLEQFPPLLMVALRFILVAAVLLPIVPLPTRRWREILLLSVTLGALHFALMFTGLDGIDASTAAIAIQLQVPFAALLAAFFFGDKLGWRRALGLAIAFAGVVVIAGEPRLEGRYGALFMVIAAAMVWAVSNVQVKKVAELSPWCVAGWMSFFAVPQLLLLSYLIEDGQREAVLEADWIGWGAILYNALAVMVVGYGIWYRLLRRYEMNQAMPITLLVPLIGVASGVLVLGEPFTWSLALGGLLTVGGVGIVVLRRPRLAHPASKRL